jgi:alkanesulfonate monooxygenase SsuD/methylene tetrahydromethanopterin reductase-like flavin-dependent oxidoreductase (luciferase family)
MRRESPAAMLVRPMQKRMRKAGRAGAEWAGRHVDAVSDVVGPEAIRDYLDSAREAIDGVVEDELRGLKKAIRRRRKKLGL